MKQFFCSVQRFVFRLGLVLSLGLSGCAAAQAGVQPSVTLGAAETLQGMRAVIAQQPGTFVMQCKDLVLFAWPRGANYAFAFVGEGAMPSLNATRANAMTLAEMVSSLEVSGWKYVTPGQLPMSLISALSATTVEAASQAMKTAVGRMPTVLLFPVIFITPMVPEGMKQ